MDKATLALWIAGASALFAFLTVIITIWRFTIERKKFNLEIGKLTRDLAKVEVNVYNADEHTELIIYDGRNKDVEEDFDGEPGRHWSKKENKFVDPFGEGEHTFNGNVIDIRRTNTGGRYELRLKSYQYKNLVQKIPRDSTIAGKRKFRLTCEVKSVNAEHTLGFRFKADGGDILDQKDYRVFRSNWTPIELVFSVSADVASFIRIE